MKDYHANDGTNGGYEVEHYWEDAAVRDAAELFHSENGGEWHSPDDPQTFYARREGAQDVSEYVVSIEYYPHFHATQQRAKP